MSSSSKIKTLQTLSCDLLEDTLKEIRSHREKNSPPNEEHFLTAEYFLQEAMEYVAGAWEMIISEKPNASIALSRWVLEASLNLLWTVADRDKIDERLKVLVGEALRNDACLLEGLAKLWQDKGHKFESKAKEARKMRERLDVERPPSLEERVKEIRQTGKRSWPELYPLYRICCAAAHPGLKMWERFCNVDELTVSKYPIDKQSIACWMAAASTFYLATYTYCLTELGNTDELKHWWVEQVVPLLYKN